MGWIVFMYQKEETNCGCFLITIAALYKYLFKAYNLWCTQASTCPKDLGCTNIFKSLSNKK